LILVVEDDRDVRVLIGQFLEEKGYRLASANERSVGAEIMRATRPVLLIADVRLRGGNGDDLAKLAHAMGIPVLLISGEPVAIRDHRGRNIPFLHKPFRLAELERQVEALIGKYEVRR
jgi:two-component system nitrogen regulation response regulator NtrX